MEIEANDRYRIELLAGDYGASIQTIELLRKNSALNNGHPRYIPYELYAKVKIKQFESGLEFDNAYQSVFKLYLANCNDEQAYSANIVFTTYDAVEQFTNSFKTQYNSITEDTIDATQALALLKSYFLYHIFTVTEPIVFKEIKLDEHKRYLLNEEVIVSPRDGAELSVIRYEMNHSKIKLRLSSMISFQRNGKTLDTNGTEPDVVIPKDLEQVLGKRDSQLEKRWCIKCKALIKV